MALERVAAILKTKKSTFAIMQGALKILYYPPLLLKEVLRRNRLMIMNAADSVGKQFSYRKHHCL